MPGAVETEENSGYRENLALQALEMEANRRLPDEFRGLLIYTCCLPCNRRGASLWTPAQGAQNPGHAPAFRKEGGTTQSEGLNTA
jgi:hypothetical protein